MTDFSIPFSRFKATGNAAAYVNDVISSGRVQGDGPFSRKCESLLSSITAAGHVVLTSSGTDGLEMACILAGIGPGDEVIMPSFTFVSTANAVVLRRGVPVFVDIDPRTLNMDPDAVRAAVTPKTKAIMPVHYAGVGCDMDQIMAIAAEHDLVVIEDAAHGMGAKWKGRHLGTIGEFGVLSFHETKNIVAGEGGAILVNDSRARERAEIVRDKGTNRKKFLRGEIDRYTWVDLGSSFLPGELQAGLLVSQLEQIDAINGRRLSVWNRYHSGLENLEAMGKLRRPQIPAECAHNAHIYWVVLADGERRGQVRQSLATRGIQATSHYECLHKSPVAARQARVADGGLPVTENVVRSILRLPLHPHLSDEDVEAVIDAVTEIVTRLL